MKPIVEKFLAFCNKHNLSIEIGYRKNHEPSARFYVYFQHHNRFHYMDYDGNMISVSFENGFTPQEALEKMARFLKGHYCQFVTMKDGKDAEFHAIFS